MDEQHADALANRVERLEASVRELQQTVRQLGEAWNQFPPFAPPQAAPNVPPPQAPAGGPPLPPPGSPPTPEDMPAPVELLHGLPPPPAPAPATQTTTIRLPPPDLDLMRGSGWWLNKVGIALLLLGLAFLFKYAVDRGWLTEQIRIAFGLALGTVLLVFGLRLHAEHPQFSQV